MRTLLTLGPADLGRAISFEDFCAADFEAGHKYELIHGRVDVSPLPDPPANAVEEWLLDKLKAYARLHPEVINFVTNKARVYIGEDRDDVSYPEPDISAYRKFPVERRFEMRWAEVSPILVVEVLVEGDPDKDLERNVRLYRMVPSICEYWILDGRENPEQPSLIFYRRQGKAWKRHAIAAGGTYTTKLLPGFTLTLNTRQ